MTRTNGTTGKIDWSVLAIPKVRPQGPSWRKQGVQVEVKVNGYEARKARTRKQKICPTCGSLFWPVRSGGIWTKHCNRKCWRVQEAKRPAIQDLVCHHCGHQFKRTKAAVTRNKTKKVFCSLECSRAFYRDARHPSFRGDKDPNRGAQWNRRAEIIRKRDGHRCRRCGKTQTANGQKLSVDHVVPWRLFQDKDEANRDENLVSLCRSCHGKKTSGAEAAMLKGDRIAFEQYRRAVMEPWVQA